MTSLRAFAAITGALALAACNVADPDQLEAEPATKAIAKQARSAPGAREPARAPREALDNVSEPQPAAPADPAVVAREWFAGRWSDTGNCADAGEFAPNGTYLLADGTRGMWNVTDSRLVVQNAGGRNVIRLRRVNDDTIEVINEDGSTGRSIRC